MEFSTTEIIAIVAILAPILVSLIDNLFNLKFKKFESFELSKKKALTDFAEASGEAIFTKKLSYVDTEPYFKSMAVLMSHFNHVTTEELYDLSESFYNDSEEESIKKLSKILSKCYKDL